jgi:uncharacterized membrane protein YkvA (DUF1232 family)
VDELLTLASWLCGGTFLLLALALALMHLPNSPLRTIAMRVLAGALVLLMPLYVVSPVDLIPEIALGPFGIVDDVVAVALAFVAGRYALKGPDPAGMPPRE